MDFLEKLKHRYATKKMDPLKPVPQEKVDRIVEAVRLAPTSSGLQPFELLVISNRELREKLKTLAWNQGQITDGSHVLVFAAWDTYTPERINAMFDLTNQERGSTNAGFEKYRQKLLATYPPRAPHENFEHAARQAYIGLGFALIAAAEEGVDCTPMEGFDPRAVDELLGLPTKGLRTVLLLPLGYREAEKDWLVSQKKVRRSRALFVTELR